MKNCVLKSGLFTLFVCLVFFLCAGNALAMTIKMSVEELTNKANTILRGTVIDLSSHWDAERTHIVTDVTISAQEYIRGYEGSKVTIQVPGGTVGELGEWVEDAPTFEKGQEVILFLGDDKYFRIVGWHQGKFTVEKGTVLEIGLPVEAFVAGIRQTIAGSPPQWAAEKFPQVFTRGEIRAQSITSINPTSGPAHADKLGGGGCASDSTGVTFYGSGWPSSRGANDHALFYYQGNYWLSGCVNSWSSNQIVARVPAKASSGDVYIYLNGTWDGPGGPFEVTYSYGGGKWPAGSYPQPMSELYYINENTSDCTGEGASVQAADTTWDNVASTDFYFRYGGTTTATDLGYNGVNEVMWHNLGSSGPIAVCTTYWFPSDPHTIVEFDIEFNDYYTWSTNGAAGTMDVQNIATHELGHALTLLDLYGSADSEKTMYGYGSTGETKQRTLEPEDEAGISYIYGGGSSVKVYLPLAMKNYSPGLPPTPPPLPTNTPTPPPCPQTGAWSGTTNYGDPISFTVSNIPSCQVGPLTIKMFLWCSGWPGYRYVTVSLNTTFPISDNRFSTGTGTGWPEVVGNFTSPTTATGTWHYWDFECHGSGTWTANP